MSAAGERSGLARQMNGEDRDRAQVWGRRPWALSLFSCGTLVFAVLAYGAAERWALSVVEAAVFLGCGVALIVHRSRLATVLRRKEMIPLGLFTALLLLQLTPLPQPVVGWLSPNTLQLYHEARFQTLAQGGAGLPDAVHADWTAPWVSLSIDRLRTLEWTLLFLAVWGLFVLVLIDPGLRFEHLILVLCGLGVFNVLVFFVQILGDGTYVWMESMAPWGSYLGTFKSPNNFAEFLETVVPLALGLILCRYAAARSAGTGSGPADAEVRRTSSRTKSRRHRSYWRSWSPWRHRSSRRRRPRPVQGIATAYARQALLFFATLLMVVAILLSSSRASIITIPVMAMAFVACMGLIEGRFYRGALLSITGLLLLALVYVEWVGAAPLIRTLERLFAHGATSARPMNLGLAWRMAADFPLFGVGFNNWPTIVLRYHTMVGREHWYPAVAYNDMLQVLAETGILGLGCLATFVGMIYYRAVAALRRQAGPALQDKVLIVAGLAAMTAPLIHSLFDYVFYLPSQALVFMAVAASVHRLSVTPERDS